MRNIKDTYGKEHSGDYFAYIRVSTDKQDVERQRLEIKNWLNGGDHKVIWFEETVSGKVSPDKRPELNKCLAMAKSVKGTIIVADLDRFSRSITQTLQFWEDHLEKGKSIKLVVVADPTITNSYQNLAMKAVFAEFERRKISERTKLGFDKVRQSIKDHGNYITKEGKTITHLGIHDKMDEARQKAGEAVAEEADVFADSVYPIIQSLIAKGESLESVANILTHSGTPTSRGGRWWASTVRNVLKRKEKGSK